MIFSPLVGAGANTDYFAAAMTDTYRLAVDRAPEGQLSLGLAVTLDPPGVLGSLTIGDRFLLDSSLIEGKLLGWGSGSALVTIRRELDGWTTTTWSLNTMVRRMRA